MKNSIFALLAIGMISLGANAQDKKSEFDKNFKVCRIDNVYKTCSENTPTIITTQKAEKQAMENTQRTIDGLRKYDTYVYVQAPLPTVEVVAQKPAYGYFNQEFEGTSAAYYGNETPINDGVAKNISRNINYLNESVDLPPMNGVNGNKRK